MDVDYANFGTQVVCLENCELIEEVSGAPIVNVDANFLIPPDQQGMDMVFPRVFQMHAMFDAAEKAGSVVSLSEMSSAGLDLRRLRRPDYADEWKLLKKAWSLARNGKIKLSNKRIAEASAEHFQRDPLDNLQDWLWRFARRACQPGYEQPFRDIMEALEPLGKSALWGDFRKEYETLSEQRGTRYYEVIDCVRQVLQSGAAKQAG